MGFAEARWVADAGSAGRDARPHRKLAFGFLQYQGFTPIITLRRDAAIVNVLYSYLGHT